MQVNNVNSKLSFKKALTTNQQKDFRETIKKSKQALGIDNGLSLLKIDAAALPRVDEQDTGVGKSYSREAVQFLKTMKLYTDANAIKDFPQGQMTKQRLGYFGAYNRGALSLGEDKINLFALTKENYGNLLKESDITPFVQSNYGNTKLINYENEIGLSDMNEAPVSKGSLPDYFYNVHSSKDKKRVLRGFKSNENRQKGPLYIAYENFKKLDENNPLKKEYREFYNPNRPVDYDDIYTRLAIAPFIKEGSIAYIDGKYGDMELDEIWDSGLSFFKNFDVNPDSLSEDERRIYYIKKEKYETIKKEYKDEIEYFKFKQFIAHKQLKESKNAVNQQGMKLFSDALIGFSHWETFVYPDAFMKGAGGRMGLPVLNYFEIQNPESPAYKLLEQKFKYNLDNYDGVRMDVGWSYINGVYQIDGHDKFKWLGDSVTRMFEKWAKEVKGPDWDLRNIVYEFDNAGELKPFVFENKGKHEQTPTRPIYELENLPGMAVFTTEYEHNDVNKNGAGWMNSYFLQNNVHLNPDKYILGTNNHDGTPLRILSSSDDGKYRDTRSKNIGALMRIYNNYNSANFENAKKFMKAKFGELFTTKNQFLFFMDVFGKKERVDSHKGNGWGENDWGTEDYRKRLSKNPEMEYHQALQDGWGFNLPDSLAMAMEAKDNNSNGNFLRNENNKKLYNELRAYGSYIADSKDNVLSEQTANEKYGNIDFIPNEYKKDYTQDKLIK